MLNFLSKTTSLAMIVDMEKVLPVLATTLIFVFIGLIVFGIAYWIVVKLAPFSVHKEIEEDQNIALGIIIGAIIIGIAMIISSAIQGN
jgi:uncharacterized membrane protein YjfL (UPF0719 family)